MVKSSNSSSSSSSSSIAALNNLNNQVRRYPKVVGGVGILTACGLILYEKHRIQKLFTKLVDTNVPNDADKKRPDYIYIKYHIYKESMRKLKEKEEEEKKWINVIINPIGKWWKSAKHSVAWRLLNIAQNGNQQERLKAVRQLAGIDHLKDWDFRHLAQICDARTAVSLARSGADTRWFVPVRKTFKNPKHVLTNMHNMLTSMCPNSCVQHFLSKYFPEQRHSIDVDDFLDPKTLSTQDTDLLKEIISFLHHITKDEATAAKVIEKGGLIQLMELRKIFAHDNETLSTLCKILANISMVEDSVEDFFVSGWIGQLAEWQTCPDLRLQVISAKVMANLDHDDPNRSLYPPNVYPLHPRLRTVSKPKADIVFIHGLMGGVFITWRQKDRKPTELGLYGKNAFYTSETDDVFLVGEQQRKHKYNGNGNGNGHEKPAIPTMVKKSDSILKTAQKNESKELEISDAATKELVETLKNTAELQSDWEVVHPDVPLAANEHCQGEFSVSGSDWQNQDHNETYTNCWPMEWLPEDYPNARVIGIDYTSAVTEWSANFSKYCPCEKGQGYIDVRATSLMERIARSNVGGDGRPIVWIGHSMGGILTKLMLTKACESTNPQMHQLATNTKGLVFLGTPHRGSSIAKWKQHMQVILSPSIEVKEMEEGAPKLLEMHSRFMSCLRNRLSQVKVVTIAEGSPTMLTTFKFPLRIVTEDSARIDYGDFYVLKDDHLSLSKPIFRQSFLYQRLLTAIRDSVEPDEGTEEQNKLPGRKLNIRSLRQAQGTGDDIASSLKSILAFFPHVLYRLTGQQLDVACEEDQQQKAKKCRSI